MKAWKAFAAQESGPSPAVDVPVGVAVFAADTTIRSLMDPGEEIGHWPEYDRGGHSAAMEVPELLVQDIRLFGRSLRR